MRDGRAASCQRRSSARTDFKRPRGAVTEVYWSLARTLTSPKPRNSRRPVFEDPTGAGLENAFLALPKKRPKTPQSYAQSDAEYARFADPTRKRSVAGACAKRPGRRAACTRSTRIAAGGMMRSDGGSTPPATGTNTALRIIDDGRISWIETDLFDFST